MNKLVKVVADDRERTSGIPELLSAESEVDLHIERLNSGDYFVENSLLFERKTLKDLIYSIIDGRIFSQAAKLANPDQQSILILEGTSRDIQKFKIKREAVQGTLIYISIILGIPVLRSTSKYETVSLMLATAKQVANIADGTVKRHGYSPKGKSRRQMFILQGLPGIGKKRAKQLIKKFESVENVVNATYEELMEIDGIGKNMADNIRYILSDKHSEYRIAKNKNTS